MKEKFAESFESDVRYKPDKELKRDNDFELGDDFQLDEKDAGKGLSEDELKRDSDFELDDDFEVDKDADDADSSDENSEIDNNDEKDDESDDEKEDESDDEKDDESDDEKDDESDDEKDDESDDETDDESDDETDDEADNEIDDEADNEIDDEADNEIDDGADNEIDGEADNEIDGEVDDGTDNESDDETDKENYSDSTEKNDAENNKEKSEINGSETSDIPEDKEESKLRDLTDDEKSKIQGDLGWSDSQLKKCQIDENGVIHYRTDNCQREGETLPNGVSYERKTVEYKGYRIEGVFPDFDSKFDVNLPEDQYKAKDYAKICNAELKEAIEKDPGLKEKFTPEQLEDIKNGRTPEGYVWHHNEEPGKIQLVEEKKHDRTQGGAAHTGGSAIWGPDSTGGATKGEKF